jgi:hypothetical protein
VPGQEETEDNNDGSEVTGQPGKMPYGYLKRLWNIADADECIAAARDDGDCGYQISWNSNTQDCRCNDSLSICPAPVYNWSSYADWTTYQYEACD